MRFHAWCISGKPAVTSERAVALRPGGQTDTGTISISTRTPPAQHHRTVTCRLHRTTAGAQREHQTPQPQQVHAITKKTFHCQFIFVIVVTHNLWFLLIRGKENGFLERPPAALEPPAKRICTISPAPRHSPAHPLQLPTQMHPTPPPLQHYALDDVTTPHLYREPHRLLDLRDLKDRARLPGTNGSYREEPVDHRLTEREWAEEWRHLDHVRRDSFF